MIYKHYKGGLYRLLCEAQDATNAADRDDMMVYVSLKNGNIYCRKKEEFFEAVEWLQVRKGYMAPRFVMVKLDN